MKAQHTITQIAQMPASHETLYLHLYADKIQGGGLWKNLCCQKQKRKSATLEAASAQDKREN